MINQIFKLKLLKDLINFFKESKLSRNVKGSTSSLKNISRKDIFKMHKMNFFKDNLVIGIGGDIDSDKAKKYVDYVFGDLPMLGKKGSPKFETLVKVKIFLNGIYNLLFWSKRS